MYTFNNQRFQANKNDFTEHVKRVLFGIEMFTYGVAVIDVIDPNRYLILVFPSL